MHNAIEPAIHYWGTPVVLVSTLNEDGSTNLAPMSSAWWLGWSCMLGLDASSRTSENLQRTRQCVLNLASTDNAESVNRLALTTGSTSVPVHKKLLGYRHERDKFAAAGLTPLPSQSVQPSRASECPVQLEAQVQEIRPFARHDARMAIPAIAVEVKIVKVHVHADIVQAGHPDRIDPDRWRPLIMSFRRLYTLGEAAGPSRLHRGPEEAYAPWKHGGVKGLAGKALSAWSRRRYGATRLDQS